jgi:ubiquitin-protein ligase
VYCPDNYPQVPPKIHIKEPKLAMPAVDSKGVVCIINYMFSISGDVDLNKLKPGFHWNSNLNIADSLMALRNNICDSDVARNSAALINQRYG